MPGKNILQPENIVIQNINAAWLNQKNISLAVLRLDKINVVISGNKWFKLKYYLKDARAKGFGTIATFGGAYSNHIAATAYACCISGLQSTGIIRGEEPKNLSHTLQHAKDNGMHLMFAERGLFKNFNKNILPNVYWIDEGGYGNFGAKGAEEILTFVKDKDRYSHIVSAVGTGTTLAGLIRAAEINQKIIGISALKNNFSLEAAVKSLLNENDSSNFIINHNYHFGGYAKHTKTLIDLMNEVWTEHQLPTDFVYTAKTFFAIKDMVEKNEFEAGSKILMIHTGGLQGNLSLPQNALQF